jgi:hypothetical protein
MENAFFVPILPGKTPDALAFAEALNGPRRHELDKAQVTVTKESWFLQQTPMGDFLIIYYHAPDASKVHQALAVSEEPFDVWFREQVLNCTGIDISTPMPGHPKQVLAWSR